MKRVRLGRNLHLVGVEDYNKNNIDLDNFSSDDEEVYNSSMMSPVKIEEASDARKDGENVNLIKKLGHNTTNPDLKNVGNDNDSLDDDAGNNTVNSIQSTQSEAETTIQRVRNFIENKRKGLNEKKKMNRLKPELDLSDSKPSPTIANSTVNGASYVVKKHPTVKGKKQRDTHQRNLRRLIHKIHKQPYNEEWTVTEWQLFQQYLNEWRLSDDDKMFQPIVLQDLFNCFIDELEIRVHSLKKFKKWKEGKRKET